MFIRLATVVQWYFTLRWVFSVSFVKLVAAAFPNYFSNQQKQLDFQKIVTNCKKLKKIVKNCKKIVTAISQPVQLVKLFYVWGIILTS